MKTALLSAFVAITVAVGTAQASEPVALAGAELDGVTARGTADIVAFLNFRQTSLNPAPITGFFTITPADLGATVNTVGVAQPVGIASGLAANSIRLLGSAAITSGAPAPYYLTTTSSAFAKAGQGLF